MTEAYDETMWLPKQSEIHVAHRVVTPPKIEVR